MPGVVAFRVEASLLYFNVDHVIAGDARPRARTRRRPSDLVICDLSTSPYVDIAGARMLTKLAAELAARGTALRLTEAHASVRDILRAEGL